MSQSHTKSTTNPLQASERQSKISLQYVQKSSNRSQGLDLDSAWENKLSYRYAMKLIAALVPIPTSILDVLIQDVPFLPNPEEYTLLHQRLDLMKMKFHLGIRKKLQRQHGFSKIFALQSLHTYLFIKDISIKEANLCMYYCAANKG